MISIFCSKPAKSWWKIDVKTPGLMKLLKTRKKSLQISQRQIYHIILVYNRKDNHILTAIFFAIKAQDTYGHHYSVKINRK